MNTTLETIKIILKAEYRKAFAPDALTVFKFNERKLAGLYPSGKPSYYNMRLYELKKDALNSGNTYTVNWVQCDCFPFRYKEGFIHLVDHCKKKYIDNMEWQSKLFVKGILKNGQIDQTFAFELIEDLIKDFYTRSSKVLAIEELQAEGTKSVLDDSIIAKFNDALNGSLWDCDASTALKVFDFSNTNRENFSVYTDKYSLFYFFLHRIFDYYAISEKKKQTFFTPFLMRYDLRYSTFKDNAKLQPTDNPENEAIRNKILDLMPLKEK
jgi:hypothetical protein